VRYLLLALLLCACNCGAADIHPAGMTRLVNALSNETAALMHQREDGTYAVKCAAVWVSEDELLTAAHCVEFEGADILKMLGLPIPEAEPAHYMTWSDALLAGEDPIRVTRMALVVRFDRSKDLALLRVEDPPPSHSIAALAEEDPYPGDVVHVMGHTMGRPWSYSPGTVGAIRPDENPNGDKVEVVQVISGANFGNSGGGLFNARGELIGICSYRTTDSSLSFFMHRRILAEFLR
jgi:hypothetical protein